MMLGLSVSEAIVLAELGLKVVEQLHDHVEEAKAAGEDVSELENKVREITERIRGRAESLPEYPFAEGE